ncbi:hypothetical protein ACFQ1L_06665 [Phytohabitans flavus]|uniref:hypothetical protein n=1 Tax=Phytohabitans flavus TaxID=1076124 RepID=UPI003644BBFE
MTPTAGRPVVPAPRSGRRVVGLAGLGVAVAAAGTLLALSPDHKQPAGPQQPRTVAEVWPDAERADLAGGLPDGPQYSPVYFLDAKTSLGTAPEPGGTDQRLVLRTADGSVRELRRLPVDGTPQFGGFVRAGDEVAWAESVSDADGSARTRMWIANVASGGPARMLTEDTGDVVLFNSEYDMVIAGGRLHWVSVSPRARRPPRSGRYRSAGARCRYATSRAPGHCRPGRGWSAPAADRPARSSSATWTPSR